MVIETDYLKGRNPETFFQIMKEKKIKKIFDIRDSPAYPIYYRPGNFAKLCNAQGIDYQYIKQLGNPKLNRVQNEKNPEKQRSVYLQLIQEDNDRMIALEQLKHEINEISEPVCLVCMCAAEDEMGCHRFWLKKLLETT
jgi:hypothetical protein